MQLEVELRHGGHARFMLVMHSSDGLRSTCNPRAMHASCEPCTPQTPKSCRGG